MRVAVKDSNRCVGCQSCMFACARRHGEIGVVNSRIRIKSAGGMENGFEVIICRACENPVCAEVCPTGALEKRVINGRVRGVIFHPEKCIGCKMCQQACIIGAVFWSEHENKPLICEHCGYCVAFCPHGVLEIER